jgi:hypothetical protein
MRWSTVVLGILAASGVAAEASALSLGSLQQAPLAEPAAAPPVPPGAANLILPPHLMGGLPAPPGWPSDAQGLPTLQDLAGASPIYTAPPPRRPRVRRP